MPYTDPNNPQPWEQHFEPLAALAGARRAYLANLSDTVDLTHGVCRAIYAHAAGTIYVHMADNDPANDTPAPVSFAAGEVKAVHARRILSSNATIAADKVWVWY